MENVPKVDLIECVLVHRLANDGLTKVGLCHLQLKYCECSAKHVAFKRIIYLSLLSVCM